MAEIVIRLVYNEKTGRKDIYIDYESDGDALPIEHERSHRSIVEKLLGKGILKEDELGEVVVERAGKGTAAQGLAGNDQSNGEQQSNRA